MSRNRFKEIFRFFRFDKKSSRSERLRIYKFALLSMLWNRFVENSIACYKPGIFLTVDEQLFPSKARCPFTQFMASKPDKYGQKYWLAADKDSKYIVNGFPYVGKDELENLCVENVLQAQSAGAQAVGLVHDKELGYCVFLLQAEIAFFPHAFFCISDNCYLVLVCFCVSLNK